MKKYNAILAGTMLLYPILALVIFLLFQRPGAADQMRYKVELNTLMQGFESRGRFTEPDLRGLAYVRGVRFLPAEAASTQALSAFYQNQNGVHTAVRPLFSEGSLLGYVRFDYVPERPDSRLFWLAEGVWLLSWLLTFSALWYIRQKILKPFHALSEMPYELSRGNLQGDLPESKARFFGKFVWGISMLRDTLSAAKGRELKLEKEKKLLLLSLSHDIKIPLSAIKLYAKALKESVYPSEKERLYAAGQIEKHAVEIEEFVREIMQTASEDILAIEVNNTEFYLEDYVDKIRAFYAPKCRLVLTDLHIGAYENKLLRGDFDRAFEAMENLMENAFKYGDGREIRITFYEEDYCQVIDVFNSGVPVSEDEMPHLFDSFYRGANSNGKDGNGLGLYIGRQIMHKMDGELFARRHAGGMSFCLVYTMPAGSTCII